MYVSKNLTDVGAALSCSTRVALMLLVAGTPLPVGEIAERLGVAQSTVSYHVEVLRRSGLVRIAHEGARHVIHGVPDEIRIPLRAA